MSKSAVSADKDLPASYSADVNRIVRLLIGKSLYPNPYIFVRELVQNAVDACNRVKEKNTYVSPKIIVKIDTQENYFEVADEGDGMSKKIVKEHFSIVGKSISQEFNDATGNFNLISQFGIGFISTFIVAQKVSITTKNEMDDVLSFTIEDVFKGFKYMSINVDESFPNNRTGTIVRVYLKREYNSAILAYHIKQYCRHISDLEVYHNSVQQVSPESWGVEGGNFHHTSKNTRYELKLTIGASSRPITASNSGFLINNNPSQIIPHRFPNIIGGEINFNPKAIDFDLSRSNIIETNKSLEVKREISTTLKNLFNIAVKSNLQELKTAILGYAQFYLTVVETEQKNFQEGYVDFFSKEELIEMCLELWQLQYQGRLISLKYIIRKMLEDNVATIFHYQTNIFFESEKAIAKYLSNKGHLLFEQKTIAITFREGQPRISNLTTLQIIASELNINVISLYEAMPIEIKNMKMDKSTLPPQIVETLSKIEKRTQSEIDIARFDKDSSPSIRIGNNHFLNYEHSNFQNLISNVSSYTDEVIEVYLLGLLRVDLSV